jgi:hypothetical protein
VGCRVERSAFPFHAPSAPPLHPHGQVFVRGVSLRRSIAQPGDRSNPQFNRHPGCPILALSRRARVGKQHNHLPPLIPNQNSAVILSDARLGPQSRISAIGVSDAKDLLFYSLFPAPYSLRAYSLRSCSSSSPLSPTPSNPSSPSHPPTSSPDPPNSFASPRPTSPLPTANGSAAKFNSSLRTITTPGSPSPVSTSKRP